ncbi:Clustered mitochondria protein-like protein [Yarrowia sp. B02]|nr:Clustered mitochondria protein-like protein [Yarrowia sp. B02]
MTTEQEEVSILNLQVTFPDPELPPLSLTVSPEESVQEIRNYIRDAFVQERCITSFTLNLNGQPIDGFESLAEIEGLESGAEIQLTNAPYNDHEARLHVIRVRELAGFTNTPHAAVGQDAGMTSFNRTEGIDKNPTDYMEEIVETKAQKEAKAAAKAELKKAKALRKAEAMAKNEDVSEDEESEDEDDAPLRKSTQKLEENSPMHGFNLEESKPLQELFPDRQNLPAPALLSLHLSHWNPPTQAQQLNGELLYLQCATLEGESYQIVAHTNGFYVANSTLGSFDPSPKPLMVKTKAKKAKKGKKTEAEISYVPITTENMHHSLYDLLVSLSDKFAKKIAANYAELNAAGMLSVIPATNCFLANPWLTKPAGFRRPDMARNQELLSLKHLEGQDDTREWSEDLQSLKELPRDSINDRVLRERHLNKTYFDFTEAAVAGAVQVVHGEIQPINPGEPEASHIFLHKGIFYSVGADGSGTYAELGGDEAARVAASKDLQAVQQLVQFDFPEIASLCTTVVDYQGKRIVCQSPVPGIFRQPENAPPQVKYGSVDSVEEIASEEAFGEAFKPIAAAFRLKTHTVKDASKEHSLHLAHDCKGLAGTDGRKYLLDLYRLAPVDIAFQEANPSYPHRLTLLRFEAVEAFFRHQVRAEIKKQALDEDEAPKFEVEPFYLNPDAFVLPSPKEDEDAVRAASEFVAKTVIPEHVEAVIAGLGTTPIDGNQLTQSLHNKGIPMRHLKTVIAAAQKSDAAKAKFLVQLCEQEIAVRSAKHLLRAEMAKKGANAKYAVAHVLNLLLGSSSNVFDTPAGLLKVADTVQLSADEAKAAVAAIAKTRFGYELDTALFAQRPVQILRELAGKLGLQLLQKNYEFGAEPFAVADVVNILPVFKTTTFRSKLVEEALEAARNSVGTDKNIALQLLRESIPLAEQVYGSVNSELTKVYNTASYLAYEMEESMLAADLGRRACIMSERCSGIDSVDAILNYLNLSLFEHAIGNYIGSLHMIKHAVSVWITVCGTHLHPDIITSLSNAITMLSTLQRWSESRHWLQNTIAITEAVGAEKQLAALRFQLAQTMCHENQYKEATDEMRAALKLFNTHYGEDDQNTKDCAMWLKSLTNAAVNVERKKLFDKQQSRLARQAPPAQEAPKKGKKGKKSKDDKGEKLVAELKKKKKGGNSTKR